MAKHGRTLHDYAQDHQWVRMLGWSDDELRSMPIHYQATSHATTGPEDEYLNLANFGNTGLGVTSLDMGGGTSAAAHSLQNVYVYRSECPPRLYLQLLQIMEDEKPVEGAQETLQKLHDQQQKQRRTM